MLIFIIDGVHTVKCFRCGMTMESHFCYAFSFVGIIFGPFVFYNDYKRFMRNETKGDKSNYALVSILLLLLRSSCVKNNY